MPGPVGFIACPGVGCFEQAVLGLGHDVNRRRCPPARHALSIERSGSGRAVHDGLWLFVCIPFLSAFIGVGSCLRCRGLHRPTPRAVLAPTRIQKFLTVHGVAPPCLVLRGAGGWRPGRWRTRKQARISTQVRRETGRRQGVQVPNDEGGANHIGPKSCVTIREGRGEALTGEPAGQPLSHVTNAVRDADAFCVAEGNTVGCVIASALPVPRGLRPWHASDTSCTGTGRSQIRPGRKARSASGRLEGRS